MGIERIKTRSQRITSSGYLKKSLESKNRCRFWLFQKNNKQNCWVSRKPGKEEPGTFLGGYFTFTIWDLGFKTSTNGQTGSGFQGLDRRTDSPSPLPCPPLLAHPSRKREKDSAVNQPVSQPLSRTHPLRRAPSTWTPNAELHHRRSEFIYRICKGGQKGRWLVILPFWGVGANGCFYWGVPNVLEKLVMWLLTSKKKKKKKKGKN